jgi:succinate dehydrogenase/fumarate reductase cytochrome b subunit
VRSLRWRRSSTPRSSGAAAGPRRSSWRPASWCRCSGSWPAIESRPPTDFPARAASPTSAVAAPPLFALLGGWLDFQHAIPIGGLGVWVVLWSALTVVAVIERPHDELLGSPPSRRLATAHGVSAAAITLFAVAHLGNHLGGLLGGDTHMAIMHTLRKVYRHSLIEPILLAAVAFQLATGGVLLWRKVARSTDWFDLLQTATGAYLMMFLLSHTTAALRARYLNGIDTNWAWASGSELLTDPWSARLAPYYFLAVIAFGVHGACGLRTVALGHGASPALGGRLVAIGAGTSALISALIFIGLVR